ncbi:MAG: hypothetical protein ACQETI_11975 [Halobacteriota archaeon]
MEESRIWAALGIALALLGLVVIAPEVLTAVQEHGAGEPIVLYGIAVVVAVITTIIVAGPSVVSSH